ncbi:uncharacterized protein LOC141911980 [Tubulanus polymorphus]|uniref:uncharacterized protein LOC141911980 n=1 Tax=Tubulanus polymorphus TaxID=672921 RepID=UPI003DA3F245
MAQDLTDDIFDDKCHDLDIANRNWKKNKDTHTNVGFRAGINEGKDRILQEGFDSGYLSILKIAKSLGHLRGELSAQVLIDEMAYSIEKDDSLSENWKCDINSLISKISELETFELPEYGRQHGLHKFRSIYLHHHSKSHSCCLDLSTRDDSGACCSQVMKDDELMEDKSECCSCSNNSCFNGSRMEGNVFHFEKKYDRIKLQVDDLLNK